MCKKSIGKQLKEFREEAGLTQIALYEISRISTFTISGLENDRIKSTSTHVIQQLQKALNVKFEI